MLNKEYIICKTMLQKINLKLHIFEALKATRQRFHCYKYHLVVFGAQMLKTSAKHIQNKQN